MKKKSIGIIVALSCFTCYLCSAQTMVQTLRGLILDYETGRPLHGATVSLTNNTIVTSADSLGAFEMKNVPLGRQLLTVSFIGYETVQLSEMISSGKESLLELRMRPLGKDMEMVVIKSGIQKNRPKNRMALVSARSFTIEETRKYAGGIDDPARLVSAFAGVATGNISDNAIIVRGNAPKGVSWRLEGIEIPTPHHFEGGNFAGGGIVTLFSSQLLANSDFFTGAFPAEYNNALSGVFDMNFRNGNPYRREFTLQLGTLGIDLSSEGAISAKSKSSYLFNYRYSTLGLLSDLNLIQTEQLFKYQDLSFKLNFPLKRGASLSMWGIAGIDNATEPLVKDSTKWQTDRDRIGFNWHTYKGAIGLTFKRPLGIHTAINTTVAGTFKDNKMNFQQLDFQYVQHPEMLLSEKNASLTVRGVVTHRFSNNNILKAGIEVKPMHYRQFVSSNKNYDPSTYKSFSDEVGRSMQYSLFASSTINLTKAFTLSSGLQFGQFSLNRSTSIEPRCGVRWQLNKSNSISIGFGMHSQPESFAFYLMKIFENNIQSMPNMRIRPAKAHHIVLAYDWQIDRNLRIKVEPYFQYLFDVPGTIDGTYTTINYKQEWFFKQKFANNTKGRNIGVDFTLEKFWANNYYYLLTGSVFSSTYKAANDVWHDTRYAKKFVGNILGGKEFVFKNKRNILGVNLRVNVIGGERFTPILIQESILNKRVLTDESRPFENQLPASFYGDVSITYRINKKRRSGIIAVQVKNIFGSPTYEGFDYNYHSKLIERTQSTAIVPAISYKLEF